MKRKIYENLIKWKNDNINMPYMLVGARQTGKTYILTEFCKNEFDNYDEEMLKIDERISKREISLKRQLKIKRKKD